MLGERIAAEQALEWGLVNRVVDDDELRPAVTRAGRQARRRPSRLLRDDQAHDQRAARFDGFAELLDLEAVLQQERADSKDFMEGVMSFVQKRPPAFTGE